MTLMKLPYVLELNTVAAYVYVSTDDYQPLCLCPI